MNWIEKIFGGTLFEGISGIISKFKLDPTKAAEVEIEIKKLLAEQANKAQEFALEEKKTIFADIANARSREVEIAKSGNLWGIVPMNLFAGVIAFCFILSISLPFFIAIPSENKELVSSTIISVRDITMLIAAYWFGSSKGSADKQIKIDSLLDEKRQ